jgi:molybdenum cofactor biosynthesis enzyme MoaA
MELRLVLTEDCPFNCYFCLNEYSGRKSNRQFFTAQDLSYFISIYLRAFPSQRVTITGGEPLTSSLFKDLTHFLPKHDVNCKLVTNGLLIDRTIESLSVFSEIHISFHTFLPKDWKRITGTQNTQATVFQNIKKLRKKYPSQMVALNVVSEKANNDHKQIMKYIEFAKNYNLRINVFKEGYLNIAHKMGLVSSEYREPEQLWDLSIFNAALLSKTNRKKNYDVDGVKITLSLTSTDVTTNESLWLNPVGEIYTANNLHDIASRQSILTDIKNRNENALLQELYVIAGI